MKNMKTILTAGTFLTLALALPSPGNSFEALEDPYTYTWYELASGVWSGVRENGPRVPVMGTSTFVVGEDGVVVFDGGGAPIMSERLMVKVAEVTDKPITHVVISHWHGDHNFGIWRIVEEFPGVQVIAHSFTYAATVGAPMDYVNNAHDAIERYMPTVEERLSTKMSSDGKTPLTKKDMEIYRYVKENQEFLDNEFERYAKTLPTVTFEDKMTIYSGNREIQLLYLGTGNTEGDIMMWLPKEKIVATGDIVVLPTPYAFNVYLKRWAQTLRNINTLGYEILVPGHGAFQYNTDYTSLMAEALESFAKQAEQFVKDGLTKEEALAKFDTSDFDERFTGGDAYVKRYYLAYFINPVLDAAYREAKGEVLVKLEREEETGTEE